MNTAPLLIAVTCTNLLLAALVFVRGRREEANRVFAVTAFSVALWTLTNAGFQMTDSPQIALLWAQVSYAAALGIAASFLHFAWVYPAPSPLFPHAKRLLWGVTFIVALMPFVPDLVIRAVELEGDRRILTNPGIYAFALFMFVVPASAFATFFHNYSGLHGVEKDQVHYVLLGSAVTAVCGLAFNLVLPLLGNYGWVWAGPASSLFLVGFTVYAIVTRQLFDIRLVIKRTLVYSLLLAAIAGGYSAVEYVLTETLRQTTQGTGHPLVTNIAGTVVVSLFVSPVRRWLEKKIDKLVFGRSRKKLPRRIEPRAKA
jgi:hypothetical protein